MSEHDNPLIDVLNQLNEQKNAAPGNALAHPGDSFPVLKAFNEYLESERRKMRQRTTLLVAITVGACLLVLVPLVVVGIILFTGMDTTQNRMLETMVKSIEKENRPIPAPVVPDNVAREFERNVAEEIRRAVADVKREIKSEIAAEQNAGFAKSDAMMQELQAQLKQVGDGVNKAIAAPQDAVEALLEKIQAAAPAPVAPLQTTPQVSSVIPVRPVSDFPELAAIRDRNNQLLSQPAEHIPLNLPPGMREGPLPQLVPIDAPRPAPVAPVAPQPAPIPVAPQDPAKPLKLDFVNTGAAETPATLSLPAPDGSTATWRLVIPSGN